MYRVFFWLFFLLNSLASSAWASTTVLTELEVLSKINAKWNYSIKASSDLEVWGVADYWATPEETLAKGAGDCEDFAIGKMSDALRQGISPEKLQLAYVRVVHWDGSTEPHMVLAYYPSPDSEPMYLDNLINDIRTASRRFDLKPVMSLAFNGIYIEGQKRGSITQAKKWNHMVEHFELKSNVRSEETV